MFTRIPTNHGTIKRHTLIKALEVLGLVAEDTLEVRIKPHEIAVTRKYHEGDDVNGRILMPIVSGEPLRSQDILGVVD